MVPGAKLEEEEKLSGAFGKVFGTSCIKHLELWRKLLWQMATETRSCRLYQ